MESWGLCRNNINNISYNNKIMALTSSEVKEMEVLIRKEIKSFMENNTLKQFEAIKIDTVNFKNCERSHIGEDDTFVFEGN